MRFRLTDTFHDYLFLPDMCLPVHSFGPLWDVRFSVVLMMNRTAYTYHGGRLMRAIGHQ